MNLVNDTASAIVSSAKAYIPKPFKKAGEIAGRIVYNTMPFGMQKITNYIGTKEKLSSEERIAKIAKEILARLPCCDSFFLVITIGTIKQATSEESLKNQANTGIKISICKETGNVDIEKNTILQGVIRWLQGDSRDQLSYINSHLLEALKVFPPNNPDHLEIYNACLEGLKILLETYNLKKEDSFILTKKENNTGSKSTEELYAFFTESGSEKQDVERQGNSVFTQKESEPHSNSPIKIDVYEQELFTELGLAKAVLISNIKLLETIKKQNSYPSEIQEKKFPSEDIQSKRTPLESYAEEFLEKHLKSFWTPSRIAGVAKIFQTPSFPEDARASIDALIKKAPSLYSKALKNLELELIQKYLVDYSVTNLNI
jgi:hypothetical protein